MSAPPLGMATCRTEMTQHAGPAVVVHQCTYPLGHTGNDQRDGQHGCRCGVTWTQFTHRPDW